MGRCRVNGVVFSVSKPGGDHRTNHQEADCDNYASYTCHRGFLIKYAQALKRHSEQVVVRLQRDTKWRGKVFQKVTVLCGREEINCRGEKQSLRLIIIKYVEVKDLGCPKLFSLSLSYLFIFFNVFSNNLPSVLPVIIDKDKDLWMWPAFSGLVDQTRCMMAGDIFGFKSLLFPQLETGDSSVSCSACALKFPCRWRLFTN